MPTAAPTRRRPRSAPVVRGAPPSVLRRILVQRQAARERMRRSFLLSVLFQLTMLLALLPLSLPALRAQREPARIEITRVFLDPVDPAVRPARKPALATEDEPEDPPTPLPPDAELPRHERLEFARAHLDPAAGPVPEDARISTQDQAVPEDRRAHARLHTAAGSVVSGAHEAADQAAARAHATPAKAQPERAPSTREAALDARAAAEERPAQPPAPLPPLDSAQAQQAREAWEPIAARVTPPATPERPAAEAPEPELARAGGSLATTPSRQPIPSARPAPPEPAPVAPEPPAVATEEHVPTFLVDPVALARAERQARAAEQEAEPADAQTAHAVGSARAAASPSQGALAAAPASLVSVEGPPTLDLQTTLATRDHPLAQALAALDDALRGAWAIPVDVRVSGIVGTTGVAFVIDRRGQVTSPSVVHPSGHARLDTLALAAVPNRVRGFRHLLAGEARDTFPAQGLRVEYRFVYEDSPIGAVR
ncbi:MAG: energy transducer TonB [Pseudomonadota bacterium]